MSFAHNNQFVVISNFTTIAQTGDLDNIWRVLSSGDARLAAGEAGGAVADAAQPGGRKRLVFELEV